MGDTGRTSPRESLRVVFSRKHQFRGADIALARRFTRVGWLLGVAVAYALFPLYPPTEAIGTAGWLVVPLGVSLPTFGWLYLLFRHDERVTFNTLLATSYMGVVLVAIEQWLAGGVPAPYHELYPFMICAAAAIHPPRRFIPFMVVTSFAVIVPELGGATAGEIGDLATELGLWLGASLMVLAVMWKLRQNRAELRAGEAQAQELARVDALTGLGNRRAFEEALAKELSRSERTGLPVSLLVCDLDNFKETNDRHGHLAGDDCLKQVADSLQAELRLVDSAFRWGGDEFVVILAGTDGDGAGEVARRLGRTIRAACSGPDGAPLRITHGHAELHEGMTGQELLAAADLALRERKERGTQRDARASGAPEAAS
jgi:diguanylate cyclase (GGDEF)-like protein